MLWNYILSNYQPGEPILASDVDIGMYSELDGDETKECLYQYILNNNITKATVDAYLPLFPDKIYKSIYETGINCGQKTPCTFKC